MIDLLLGSDIGLWVAQTVPVEDVRRVTTDDPEIAGAARRRGIPVGPVTVGWRALSVHYPRILGPDVLDWYAGVYNLHPGFLPWGRGHFPLVWAIANREPAGATLHRMTDRVDAGPIVDQIEVDVASGDTAGNLHARIRVAERVLFLRWWPCLVAPEPIPERNQPPGGSYHDKAAFAALLATPTDDERVHRATTFPGKPGVRVTRPS